MHICVHIQQLTILELSDGLMTVSEMIDELTDSDDNVTAKDVTDAITALFYKRLIIL
jgi:hypothetical protein